MVLRCRERSGEQSLLTTRRVFDPHAVELAVALEDFAAQLLGLLVAERLAVVVVAYGRGLLRVLLVGFRWSCRRSGCGL